MSEILSYLVEPYESYSQYQIILEIIAALTGVLSVIFAARRNIWVFPTGLITTSIYVYLLLKWGLYGDMMINAYYFIMNIYGWYIWSSSIQEEHELNVSWMNYKERITASWFFCLSVLLVLLVYYFKPYIHGTNPEEIAALIENRYNWIDWVDSFTTAVFFVGMWLMARKKIENWIFWIVGDVIAIPMYLVKGFGITALQYFIFIIPAVIGLISWIKKYKMDQ